MTLEDSRAFSFKLFASIMMFRSTLRLREMKMTTVSPTQQNLPRQKVDAPMCQKANSLKLMRPHLSHRTVSN